MKFLLFIILLFGIGPMITPSDWTYNVDQAVELANQEDKDVLIIFSGSDWCKPCMRLKEKVLLTEEFGNYAADHLVIAYLDFPIKKQNVLPKDQKQHNEEMAEKFNPSGAFPHLVLLDQQGEIIHSVSFKNQKPGEFIEEITKYLP